MFNKFFLVFFVFVLFLSFGSALKVVFPVEAEYLGNSIELGRISPGQSFELIVFDERFDSVSVEGQFSSWAEESVFQGKNISVVLTVPENASFGTKKISFSAFNSVSMEAESFDVLVNVQNDLWSVNISNLQNQTQVNFPAEYFLVFSNESIGQQKILVFSNLPSYWFESKTFIVEPKSVLKESVFVYPKHYGKRQFTFSFESLFSDEKKEFLSVLSVESSLSSKYSASLYGFPFFTPSLFPFYLIESFIGFFLNEL